MANQFGSKLDEHGFERYEENQYPIAYLLTFRTYGTWLHGDERKSMQRSRDDRFSTVRLEPNVPLHEKMTEKLSQSPTILSPGQRQIVEASIRETCDFRRYRLLAVNIRTNHAHAVISAAATPEKIVNDLKSYATRRLREVGEAGHREKIWSRGASTRYLWKPRFVEAAIEYVLYSQGDVPFEMVYEIPET